MKLLFLVGLAGCFHGAEPIAPMQAPPPPPPARPAASIHEMWGTYAAGPLVARTPAGPYGDLESACRMVARTPKEHCEVRSVDELEGTHLALGALRYSAEVEGDAMSPPIDDQAVAIKAPSGAWYVLPHFAELGLRYSALDVQPELAGDVLLLRYRHTHGNKWSGDTDTGVVACKLADGTLACTPKVVLRNTSYQTNDRMNPGGIQAATLACGATLAADTLAIAPLAQDANDLDYWTAEAAAACAPAALRIEL